MSRWSLGKSIGQAFLQSQSLNPCRYNNLSRRNPLSSYNYGFINPPNPFRDYHERKCGVEEEAKVGADSDQGIITSIATKCRKDLKKQKRNYRKVTEGDVIDLRQFLFTDYRDYLIRYNDKTRVKAEHLAGKVILIYFVSLSTTVRLCEEFYTSLLLEIYNYLSHSHAIEIVFVATDDGNESESKKRFEDIFSRMPWTSIPFSDVECRKSLKMNLHVRGPTSSFVVDSNGMVLQCNANFIMRDYGVLGFPFSDERIELVDAEDDAAVQKPSLLTLLGSPQRDYVITNKGEKVPIHTLQGKVVALYFCEDGFSGSTEKLKKLYEELANTKENFEVVLIYITDTGYTYNCTNEEAFWKAFKTMPWLALPFKDLSTQKLKRIFKYPPELYEYGHFDQLPSLVFVGPHGEFIKPLGNCISGTYPVSPFTCEEVAKLETKKVQNLKMEMLWDPNTVFRRTDGLQMRFSQLVGKRVIHFFEREDQRENERYFLMKLKERYLDLKGTNDEFEVIHILEKEMDTMPPIQDLPWFVSVASELLPDAFDFYGCYGVNSHLQNTLLAFDRDGKLVRRTIFPVFENPDFPFYAGSLEEETLSQLIDLFGCDYWDLDPNTGRIYTLHRKLRHIGYRVWRSNIQSFI